MLFEDTVEQGNGLVFLRVDNPGVTLGVPDGGMPEQLAGGINIYTCCKAEGCEAVPRRMGSEWLSKEKQTSEDKT